jgi:predicted metallo-beta-lactamase superfamily hydrolase
MRIEILGSESLGVRGLSCVVRAHDRIIVIDPGVALGYRRNSLLPHPFQVAVGENVRQKIIAALKSCTDIVMSHFHGDHIPLPNANPFQVSAQKVSAYFQRPKLWCQCTQDLSPAMARRRQSLSRIFKRQLDCSEGQTDGFLSFSFSMPHGEANSPLGSVMMTRVAAEADVFVHASDIQLLDDSPIEQILSWNPSVVLASGPALYLRRLSSEKRKEAYARASILAKHVPELILDHHMLRNEEGFRWLENLSASAGRKIYCAADYMKCNRVPLESWRERFYREMPVPEGWHKAYALGRTNTIPYRKWRDWDIQNIY